MRKSEFVEAFCRLCVSKQFTFQEEVLEVYWEDLRNLEYLKETIEECRHTVWYRDFEKTVARFPQSIEIIMIHKEIKKKKVPKLTLSYIDNTPSKSDYLDGKPDGYTGVLFHFSRDCMTILDLNCEAVWEYCEINDIEIPIDYRYWKNQSSNFKDFASDILGRGMESIRKVERVKNNVNYNHILDEKQGAIYE